MMNLDEAIQHCEEVAEENEEIYEAHCRIYSKEVVEKYPSPPCKKCADEHRQLAEWLKELKAYRGTWSKLGMWLADTRLAIAPDETVNDVDEELVRVAQVDMIDTVLEWMDEHEVEAKQNCTDCIIDGTDACSRGAGRAVNDEICGDFIPSRSEIPTSCGDAISRQSAISLADDLKQDLPDDEHIADMVMAHNEGILEYQTQLSLLLSVSPQQRTGRWIYIPERRLVDETDEGGVYITDHRCTCSECGGDFGFRKMSDAYCKYCGAKMEVEE